LFVIGIIKEDTYLFNLCTRARLIATVFNVSSVAATRIATAVSAAAYALVNESYEYVSHIARCVCTIRGTWLFARKQILYDYKLLRQMLFCEYRRESRVFIKLMLKKN
jgi:hypothetical protein